MSPATSRGDSPQYVNTPSEGPRTYPRGRVLGGEESIVRFCQVINGPQTEPANTGPIIMYVPGSSLDPGEIRTFELEAVDNGGPFPVEGEQSTTMILENRSTNALPNGTHVTLLFARAADGADNVPYILLQSFLDHSHDMNVPGECRRCRWRNPPENGEPFLNSCP